jgi:hypothetical protein
VFVGGPYATIAAAIAQAVADGANIGRPATVLISPKTNGWVEDINLVAGVNIQGLWAVQDYGPQIKGKISYTPGAGGNPSQKVNVTGLYILGPVGKPAIEIVGTNAGTLYVKDCIVDKFASGDTTPNVVVNGNVSSGLVITDCIGNIFTNGTAYQILSGKLTATNCQISSNVAARGLEIGANGAVYMANNCVLASNGPDVVNVVSGGSYLFVNTTISNSLANSSGIVQQGTAPFQTGALISCNIVVPTGTGYAVSGTGLLTAGNNLFSANAKVKNKPVGSFITIVNLTTVFASST